MVVGSLNGSIKFCIISIVITNDGCFIFLTNNTTVDKEVKCVRQLMLLAKNLNHNYNINIYTFNWCSNYLLAFIITCLTFSVYLPLDFVDVTEL